VLLSCPKGLGSSARFCGNILGASQAHEAAMKAGMTCGHSLMLRSDVAEEKKRKE